LPVPSVIDSGSTVQLLVTHFVIQGILKPGIEFQNFASKFPSLVFTIGALPEPMKMELTPENSAALAKYAASAGQTPAEFLNRYFSDPPSRA